MFLQITILSFLCTLPYIIKAKNSFHQNKFHFDLIGGNSSNEGYLAIFVDQNWHYVCKDFWDRRNSKVICKELGYDKVFFRTNQSSSENASSYPLLHMNFRCEGHENILSECSKEYIDLSKLNQVCKSDWPVYVTCSNKIENAVRKRSVSKYPIKLKEYRSSNQNKTGLLLSFEDDEWVSLCVSSWSNNESSVACKELGYSNFQNFKLKLSEKKEFTTRDVKCNGNEINLSKCYRELNKLELCHSVILSCYRAPAHQPYDEFGALRLRGGSREGEGRVEIFANHAWGTICDDGWNINNADVVCYQLGFGSAIEATHWSEHGQGTAKIHYRNVRCYGNETKLLHCRKEYTLNKCTHLEDAGVRCHTPDEERKRIRLYGSKNSNEGRVEVFHDNGWYGVCGIGFTQREGQVVCRQLGLGYIRGAYRGYDFGINYQKVMFDVRCVGNESYLHECQYNRYGRCRYYDMASIVCTKYSPDLIMDIDTFAQSIKLENRPLTKLTCAFEEKCLDPIVDRLFYYNRNLKRRLLRFSSRFMNLGTSSFVTHQRKGDWKWHSCHKHYHSMEVFATYDLVDSNGTRVAIGHKASFCLEDSECDAGYRKTFNCTNKGDQGISVNCADNYKNTLDCQWIDITEVPYGNYSLSVVVNPKKLVGESDWLNNRGVCELHYYSADDVEVKSCNAEPCYQPSYGGNGYGHCCHFPFVYNDVKYYSCITENSERPWCATTYHFQRDRTWGYCNEIV